MIVQQARPLALCPLMFILFLCLPAAAAIWHVNPAGTGDVPTIQAAVNVAADGDEILLADGTFTGLNNRRVDLLGKRVIIRSESGYTAACIIDGENVSGSGFRFHNGEGPDTQLADLTLTGMVHESEHCAVYVYDCAPTLRNVRITAPQRGLFSWHGSPSLENVVVRDCSIPALTFLGGAATLTGCVLESNLAVSSTGAVVAYETDLALTDCAIRDCGHMYLGWGAGLDIERCDTTIRDTEISGNGIVGIEAHLGTLILENCTVEDHWSTGVRYQSAPGFVDELVVRDCTIRNNGSSILDAGIQAGQVAGLTVENVVFEGNAAGLRVWDYSDHGLHAVVRGCDVRNNSYLGIGLQRCNATLEECTIAGNDSTGGVYLDNCPMIEVRDCLVVGNADRGLRIRQSSSSLIEGTTIAGNGGASTGGGLYLQWSWQVTLRNTIVWDNCADDDTEIAVLDGCSLELSCVNVDTGRIGGAGTVLVTGTVLESDPLFCDPLSCLLAPVVGGDYRLMEDSPALYQPCGPMGSEEGGCAISLTPLSWSVIKARYR
jgi:hypothetical protein